MTQRDWQQLEALLFDLDGVLTDTARLHADCWKQTFDAFLESYARETGQAFQPFDIATDYREHVDGKPRYDGVRDFLASRDIRLPEGDPSDGPEVRTVCGVGNRKNALVSGAIRPDTIQVYQGSVELVRRARKAGQKTALVSSSANARSVLEAAGIEDLFDVRVDGRVAAERALPGKPAPDTFLEAARELGVAPEKAAVIEDAVAGVQAGRAGGFGLVLGVARHDDTELLASNGADVVVSDLSELLD
ncbi:MAG: beta-phosphoglucomutase family hydrolase [Myxococcota bacterium]|nr:beta-phosphoglucomutase family hydrolase [Myxococcota bacterium]